MASVKVLPWYTLATAYVGTPDTIKKELLFSDAKRCTLMAIAGCPPALGLRLEVEGVGWRDWQHVAHGDGAEEQHRRAARVLQRRSTRQPRSEATLRWLLALERASGLPLPTTGAADAFGPPAGPEADPELASAPPASSEPAPEVPRRRRGSRRASRRARAALSAKRSR